MLFRGMLFGLLTLLCISENSGLYAGVVSNNWVIWSGAPNSFPNSVPGQGINYATSASGTLIDPVTLETINVTYNGEVTSNSEFNNPTGTDMFNYAAYDAPTVVSRPPRGDFIATTGFGVRTQSLTFSKPVTNLMLALASLGSINIPSSYQFDRTAVVASFGAGKFGNGNLYMKTLTEVEGNEGNGIVQFTGTFTTLTWYISEQENYSAFNVGISNTSAVPEPTSLAIFGIGALGVAYRARRKSKQIG